MTENTNPKPFNLSRQKCSAEQLMYINNNNNNNLDDIYSAVINGDCRLGSQLASS